MAPSREQLLRTATTFITNFNRKEPEAIVEIRSPSCMHEIRPSSVAIARTYTNDEYLTWWKENTLSIMPDGMVLTVDDTAPVIDETSRTVVLYVRSKAESLVGSYENSYVWNLAISEDGTAVDRIVEFVDSQTIAEFTSRVMAAMRQAQ